MIKNRKLLDKLIDGYDKKEQLTYKQALKLFEAMWEEGRTLGVLPPKDPLEGIETVIKIAKILNSCSKKS